MKIAIMGAGALGCYFGGRLVDAGYDVSFVARGAHLEALRRDGLRVESGLGDIHIAAPRVTDDPDEIGPVDLVIFLAKLYDTEDAATGMLPLIGDGTAVVSFQNGINGWERIGRIVGDDRVLGGIAYIFADVRAPGIVRHGGSLARLVFGEFGGARSARGEALYEALTKAGVDAHLVDDIDVRIWEKFVILSALSGTTSLTRLPIGDILADELSEALFCDAVAETAAVGRRRCPGLSPDIADRQIAFARNLPHGMRSSMLDDLERGKRLELADLSGEVARLGRKLDIPTPVHATIHRALHPYVDGRPERDGQNA